MDERAFSFVGLGVHGPPTLDGPIWVWVVSMGLALSMVVVGAFLRPFSDLHSCDRRWHDMKANVPIIDLSDRNTDLESLPSEFATDPVLPHPVEIIKPPRRS